MEFTFPTNINRSGTIKKKIKKLQKQGINIEMKDNRVQVDKLDKDVQKFFEGQVKKYEISLRHEQMSARSALQPQVPQVQPQLLSPQYLQQNPQSWAHPGMQQPMNYSRNYVPTMSTIPFQYGGGSQVGGNQFSQVGGSQQYGGSQVGGNQQFGGSQVGGSQYGGSQGGGSQVGSDYGGNSGNNTSHSAVSGNYYTNQQSSRDTRSFQSGGLIDLVKGKDLDHTRIYDDMKLSNIEKIRDDHRRDSGLLGYTKVRGAVVSIPQKKQQQQQSNNNSVNNRMSMSNFQRSPDLSPTNSPSRNRSSFVDPRRASVQYYPQSDDESTSPSSIVSLDAPKQRPQINPNRHTMTFDPEQVKKQLIAMDDQKKKKKKKDKKKPKSAILSYYASDSDDAKKEKSSSSKREKQTSKPRKQSKDVVKPHSRRESYENGKTKKSKELPQHQISLSLSDKQRILTNIKSLSDIPKTKKPSPKESPPPLIQFSPVLADIKVEEFHYTEPDDIPMMHVTQPVIERSVKPTSPKEILNSPEKKKKKKSPKQEELIPIQDEMEVPTALQMIEEELTLENPMKAKKVQKVKSNSKVEKAVSFTDIEPEEKPVQAHLKSILKQRENVVKTQINGKLVVEVKEPPVVTPVAQLVSVTKERVPVQVINAINEKPMSQPAAVSNDSTPLIDFKDSEPTLKPNRHPYDKTQPPSPNTDALFEAFSMSDVFNSSHDFASTLINKPVDGMVSRSPNESPTVPSTTANDTIAKSESLARSDGSSMSRDSKMQAMLEKENLELKTLDIHQHVQEAFENASPEAHPVVPVIEMMESPVEKDMRMEMPNIGETLHREDLPLHVIQRQRQQEQERGEKIKNEIMGPAPEQQRKRTKPLLEFESEKKSSFMPYIPGVSGTAGMTYVEKPVEKPKKGSRFKKWFAKLLK